MDVKEDYLQLDATDLADLVQRREVTPAELVEVAISQLEHLERLTKRLLARCLGYGEAPCT